MPDDLDELIRDVNRLSLKRMNNSDIIRASDKLVDILKRYFGAQARDLIRLLGNPPDIANLPETFYQSLTDGQVAILEPYLADVYVERAQRLIQSTTFRPSWSIINKAGRDWARQYTYDMVKGITATSRELISRAVWDFMSGAEMTINDLSSQLTDIFGEVRATMIARTEVTRAAVEADRMTVREIQRENPNINLVPVWNARNGEQACPDCEPLDGLEYGKGWTEYPPLHPNCYCTVDYELR